ncbi:unnamed protein product [Microthlaspi erraticum]|uniref:Leucine-rich repeat-containing N-terminal plant-type domain-containing protein n=1 Tax=Microthlaspi erraticum TaxID=1685480 RepID=A0A6D2JMI1_9BRAS|nr:unnamed protein product [Microthlaspi erraticum]CAA7037571.1 unnamed protein product [Microthlaspi erraticum]
MGFYHYRWVMMILVALELCFFYSSQSQHDLTCHPRDLAALRDFINVLEPKPDGWALNSSADCCEWVGISCNSSYSLGLNDQDNNTARVTKLELAYRQLSGTLSESLGTLDQIRVLNLSRNPILGSIPPSVFNLVNLETLDLRYTELTGKIPESLNLPSLVNLDLSSNLLDGSLPSHVCQNSTKLKLIRLDWKGFSGDFPSGFEKCALLEQLFLGRNKLTCKIPEDVFQLQRLKLLEINDLSGSLSPALGNLSRLVHLDVSCNNFSGEIPDVFNKLPEIEYLMAESNRFTGGFPKSLANSRTLILLNLKNNSLSGPLHLNCTMMTNLTSLDLESNQLNSSLPESLSYCRNLKYVSLARNHFDGELPESYKNLHNLEFLSLLDSSLVNISSTLHTLQHCKNLTTLILTSNFADEMLPDDPNLHFEKLKVFVVQNSRLTGSMPSWLSKSTDLEVLDLSWNSLTGSIPNWIGGFANLFYLDLSRNSFTGEIPKGLTRLQSLSSRDNSLQWCYPFMLRRNDFVRNLGFDFRPTLDLSYNNLYGPIWEEFGNLKKLLVFSLCGNRLSGSIPSTISEMTSLWALDLSYNRISGSIPESLEKLTSLSKFVVANNNLSGRIPSGGRFILFSRLDFEGNHFCGGDYFPQCELDTPHEAEQSRTSDSDFVLDFSYGVALGYSLALVIAAYLTCSAFELPAK